ncbi:MAG: carbohydrate ABC transporter permease [Anaerolineaceae bacterium]|nr:carbohydrate ABC transporter permease [Anaerolineaceae bacterium]
MTSEIKWTLGSSIRFRKSVKSFLVYILVILTCVITFFPLYWMVLTAMLHSGSIFRYPPLLFPPRLSLESFVEIMRAYPLARWFGNTIFVAVISTFSALLISVFGAYSLSRYRFKGRLTAITAILITQMVPPPLFVIPLYVLFRDMVLLDTYTGLIIGHTTFTLPLCIWMLKGFFDSVSTELEEAAMLDGCSRVGALFRIILPLSLPGLAATTVLAVVTSWNEFALAVTLMNTKSKWMLSVGLTSFIGEYQIPWNQVAAGAIVMVLPIVLAFAYLQKYLISGLSAGAIKG